MNTSRKPKCPGCGSATMAQVKLTVVATPLGEGKGLNGGLKGFACAECRLVSFFVSEIDVPALKQAPGESDRP